MVVKYETNSGAPSNYQELKMLEVESQDKYFQTRDSYQSKYEKLTRHIQTNNKTQINPYIISKNIVSIFQSIRKIHSQNNTLESNRLLDENDKELEVIW